MCAPAGLGSPPLLAPLPGMDLETGGSPDLISKTNILELEPAPFALRPQILNSSSQAHGSAHLTPQHRYIPPLISSTHVASVNCHQLCNEAMRDGL